MIYEPGKEYAEETPFESDVYEMWTKASGYDGVIPNDFSGVIKNTNGDIGYYENGNLHREDGPAYIGVYKEDQYYYLDSTRYSKESWQKELEQRDIKKTPNYFKNLL